MPTSADRHLNAFKSHLLDNSENVVFCEAEVPTSQIFRDLQASSNASKTLTLSSLKIPQQVEMPAKSTFLEEIQGRETFHQFSVFIFAAGIHQVVLPML